MIKYICFYQNGQEGTFPHIKNFFNSYFNNEKHILIIGPHIKSNHLSLIINKNFDKKILAIFEPIKNFTHYQLCCKIIENYKKYNLYLFGCVENNPEQKNKVPTLYDGEISYIRKS